MGSIEAATSNTRGEGQVRVPLLAGDQRLAVLPALQPLVVGGGLRRGSTLSIDGPASVSLALAAAAAASQDGGWVAAVGFPSLGLLAAAELGVVLERFVLVASPPVDQGGDTWAPAIAALVDAFEIVLVQADHPIRARDARRLVARVREQRSVLIQVGSRSWPEGADVTFRVTDTAWEGLGEGHGHLRARRVTIRGGGRREAARPRSAALWLPSAAGTVEPVMDEPVPLRSRASGP